MAAVVTQQSVNEPVTVKNTNDTTLNFIKSYFYEKAYLDTLQSATSFNRRLFCERKMRLPFFDGQTGVAQNHCCLWMNKRQRMPGMVQGQLYSYPTNRWRKKRRQYLINVMRPKNKDADAVDADGQPIKQDPNAANGDGELNEDSKESWFKEKDSWYKDYEEDESELVDYEEPESDYDDYEETYTKRRRKKTQPGVRRRRERASDIPDSEKPYACEQVSSVGRRARQKWKPTAAYGAPRTAERREEKPTERNVVFVNLLHHSYGQTTENPDVGGKSGRTIPTPSTYCDFCLGSANENKKTKQAEELISCSDCGRSGHPSCLQFTQNMMISVKAYRWQCIECKCCSLCGNSDNDEQLLFCDDCDRGYHMYCLDSPLHEPPEGSWSCHLCVEEFHKK